MQLKTKTAGAGDRSIIGGSGYSTPSWSSGGLLFFLTAQYGTNEFFLRASAMALLPLIPVLVLVGRRQHDLCFDQGHD